MIIIIIKKIGHAAVLNDDSCVTVAFSIVMSLVIYVITDKFL